MNARAIQPAETVRKQKSRVDKALQQVPIELTAMAALRSRAFARSLRSWEERLAILERRGHRSKGELQLYYEYLHQIYAELNEPDGMEGISTKVICPSLEHQIREHESVGRWAAAQSCWELRLQRQPDELEFHLGLLRCLRNIGHYGKQHRTHL